MFNKKNKFRVVEYTPHSQYAKNYFMVERYMGWTLGWVKCTEEEFSSLPDAHNWVMTTLNELERPKKIVAHYGVSGELDYRYAEFIPKDPRYFVLTTPNKKKKK